MGNRPIKRAFLGLLIFALIATQSSVLLAADNCSSKRSFGPLLKNINKIAKYAFFIKKAHPYLLRTIVEPALIVLNPFPIPIYLKDRNFRIAQDAALSSTKWSKKVFGVRRAHYDRLYEILDGIANKPGFDIKAHRDFIQANKLEKRIEKFQKVVKHPKSRQILRRTLFGLYRFPGFYGMLIAMLAMLGDEKMDPQNFLTHVHRHDPDDPNVFILVDYSFFPHLSVLIGDMVYSFSSQMLVRYKLNDYLLNPMKAFPGVAYEEIVEQQSNELTQKIDEVRDQLDRLRERARELEGAPDVTTQEVEDERVTIQNNLHLFEDLLQDLLVRKRELSDQQDPGPMWARTYMAIQLNLSPSVKKQLEKSFKDLLWQDYEYEYELFSNNCASRALELLRDYADIEVPGAFIVSPSQSIAYIKASRLIGNNKIGDIYYINMDPNEGAGSDMLRMIRNWYVSSVETKLFLAVLPYTMEQRGKIEPPADIPGVEED